MFKLFHDTLCCVPNGLVFYWRVLVTDFPDFNRQKKKKKKKSRDFYLQRFEKCEANFNVRRANRFKYVKNFWFLYVGRLSFEWAKHGERCQRNTTLINVLYFILRSFEFIRFRIFYYVFKVVLTMLSKYDQKTGGILYFLIVLF